MNEIVLAVGNLNTPDIVRLLIIAIVVGAIWYIFNLVPNIPPMVKTVVTVIACAVLAIFAIQFLASLI